MSFRKIGSAHAKYLAATDVLIGDMSCTNYEFLLYDRPVILLANEWLRDNFPDIGIKTDLDGLLGAIERSIRNPDEFKAQRKYWLEKTIYKPDGLASTRCIDIILSKCQIKNPRLVFVHGNDSVRKTNLEPLLRQAKRRGTKTKYVATVRRNSAKSNTVYIGAHYKDLLGIRYGYKVHLDHDLKGKATMNVKKAIKDHEEHDYMPFIDLYITPGEVGDEYTKMVLGHLNDRRIIVGYPKSDDLLKRNTRENRVSVFKELGFNLTKPLITYAPSAKKQYAKPGGSLSEEVIDRLRQIAEKNEYNILVKLKYPEAPFLTRLLIKVKGIIPIVRSKNG